MGCGLDTRPAALACLRILIAALNIIIAVSSFSCFCLRESRYLYLDIYSNVENAQGMVQSPNLCCYHFWGNYLSHSLLMAVINVFASLL